MNSTVCGKAGVAIPTVKQGPGTPSVLAIECPLPDLGTFQKDPKPPLSLTLEVTLRGGKPHRSFRLEEQILVAIETPSKCVFGT